MRVWLYRWPNGDSSVVWANNRTEAALVLDEFDAANPEALIPLPPGAIDLPLCDDGELDLGQITERVERIIAEQYPVLEEVKLAIDAMPDDGGASAITMAVSLG
jgi:hypothetical protein